MPQEKVQGDFRPHVTDRAPLMCRIVRWKYTELRGMLLGLPYPMLVNSVSPSDQKHNLMAMTRYL